eukprot:6181079-Pleurochrysis_carterae.AAC.1
MALLLAVSRQGAPRSEPRNAPRTLAAGGDRVPAAATIKLVALKADTGEAGFRAAEAVMLEPLTSLAVQRREWLTKPAAGPPVPTLARLTAEAGYGDAVWAAVYSNGKYTGVLAAEGVVPSAVVTVRPQLVVLLRSGVETAVQGRTDCRGCARRCVRSLRG